MCFEALHVKGGWSPSRVSLIGYLVHAVSQCRCSVGDPIGDAQTSQASRLLNPLPPLRWVLNLNQSYFMAFFFFISAYFVPTSLE